jgi:hypothetical protein
MKIAYIILAHKNIPQIRCLLKALQGANISIHLHLDLLAGKQIFQEAIAGLEGIHNLTFLKRCATPWGSFGLIQATLEGIKQVLAGNNFDYVILLSGQDYPLKSRLALQKLLEENNGKSFMEHYAFPHPLWKDRGGYDRVDKWYFSFPVKQTWVVRKIRGKLNQLMNILIPNRKFPGGFVPYGGAQWWCLHRECIAYIENFVEENKQFIRFFKTVRIPDEILFHTLLMNSPLSKNIINRKLTYVDWNGPPSPRILNGDDIQTLHNGPYYFARKFDITLNPGVIDTLNKNLSN